MGKDASYPSVGLPALMVHRGHGIEVNGKSATYQFYMSTGAAYVEFADQEPAPLHPGDVIGLPDGKDGFKKRTFSPYSGYKPKLPPEKDSSKH